MAQVTERTRGSAEPRTEVAKFQKPRLPWHDEIESRFGDMGVNKASWKALVEAVFPAARTVDSVVMALSYCKARKLDPFKKPVHIVPVWDSEKRGYVETVWPGISELRTTAMRTGQMAGMDAAEFGPEIEETFEGEVKRGDSWQTERVTIRFPQWCQVTVYRMVEGQRVAFVGPKVYWREAYASQGKSTLPNAMWQKRSIGQLEKCAEAAALRRAFPEELGNEYAAEEMEGQRFMGDHARDITPAHEAPPAPKRADFAKKPAAEEAEIVEDETEEPFPGDDATAGGSSTDSNEDDGYEPDDEADEQRMRIATAYVAQANAELLAFDSASAVRKWLETTFRTAAEKKGLSAGQIARVEKAAEDRIAFLEAK